MILLDENKVSKNKQIQTTNHAILDENNIIGQKSKKSKKTAVKSSFADIAPIIDVTHNDFFEMRNGEYLEILQIETKDIYSLNASDLENDISNLMMFYTAFNDDFKIVPLNVPMSLEQQKRYMYKKLKTNKNPAYEKFLQARMKEFENLEKYRTSRAYFLFVYSDDEKKLLEKIHQLRGLLSRSNPLTVLSLENKMHILFQMFNPNTKPLSDNE